jgi:hypothetical protein
MRPLDQLKEKASKKGVDKKKTKRERKENYRELKRKLLEQLGQFTLNHLHKGHLLYFKKVMRFLGKKKT